MTVRIFRPIYEIEELGELGRLPDGAIVNIGGTSSPTFTVGGVPVMLGVATAVTLQAAYANGITGNIDLTSGKPFTIEALNGKRFIVNPATGAVTIEGDLSVLGDSVIIDKTIQNVDQLNVRMPTAGTVGIDLRPDVGITPTTNLIEIRNTNGGLPIFTVDAAGDTHVQNLIVGGNVDGVDVSSFYAAYTAHVNAAVSPPKHAATQISYSQGANVNVTGATVQAALDSIESALASFTASDVQGYEHVQALASDTWIITHGANSKRVQVTIWDSTDEQVFADTVVLTSVNQVTVTFNTAMTGRAILMIF